MCLGIPALICSRTDGPLPMAEVDQAGEKRAICLAYVPEAKVGDYVVIQTGFAHAIITKEEAMASLELMHAHHLIAGQRLDTPQTAVGEPSDNASE